MGSHQSARMKSDIWLTPRDIVEPLGAFDLDPCSIDDHPWQIGRRWFTAADDGLRQEWHGRVWLNPPFSSEAAKWIEKLAKHYNGVALVAARTETKWWWSHIWERADGVLFLRGRPHFHRPDGTRAAANSGTPIALIAYGEHNADVLRRFWPSKGAFVTPDPAFWQKRRAS